MARVSNKTVHGKLGDLVYRSLNGQQYVKPAGDKKSIPDSEAYRESTAGFGVCCKLGAVMSRIKVLKDHWENADVDAFMARSKFVKFNRNRLLPGGDVSRVQLVSDSLLHPVNLLSAVFSGHELICVFETDPPDSFCKEVSLQGVVQLSDPKDPAYERFMFFPVVSCNYRFPGDLEMNANFSSQNAELMKMYNSKNVLLNLAFKDVEGAVRKFSETIKV